MVPGIYSIALNVCKHLVYNVSKFHNNCLNGFGDMRWFASPPLFLALSHIYCLSFWFRMEQFSSLIMEPILSQEHIAWHESLYNPSTTLFFNVVMLLTSTSLMLTNLFLVHTLQTKMATITTTRKIIKQTIQCWPLVGHRNMKKRLRLTQSSRFTTGGCQCTNYLQSVTKVKLEYTLL